MNPVETLRAAADRLDELAASASGGTWWAQELSDDEPFGGWEVMNGLVGMEEHQVAATSDFCSTRCRPDALWIATLGPQVAPALSGWLRDTARRLRWDTNADGWTADRWEDFLQVHQSYGGPVRFARMVLGKQAGDPS